MRWCPQCDKIYEEDVRNCPKCKRELCSVGYKILKVIANICLFIGELFGVGLCVIVPCVLGVVSVFAPYLNPEYIGFIPILQEYFMSPFFEGTNIPLVIPTYFIALSAMGILFIGIMLHVCVKIGVTENNSTRK